MPAKPTMTEFTAMTTEAAYSLLDDFANLAEHAQEAQADAIANLAQVTDLQTQLDVASVRIVELEEFSPQADEAKKQKQIEELRTKKQEAVAAAAEADKKLEELGV